MSAHAIPRSTASGMTRLADDLRRFVAASLSSPLRYTSFTMQNSWVILLLILGWSAVQMIVTAAAKKQEKQKQRELEERRRQMAQQAASGTAPSQVASHTPTTISAQQPNKPTTTRDELAARRQAQLEELRRRRMQQSGGSSSGSSTVTRVPSGQPQTKPGGGTQAGRSNQPTIQSVPSRAAKQPAVQQTPKKPTRSTTPQKPSLRQTARLEAHNLHNVSRAITAGKIGSTPSPLGTPIGAAATTARADRNLVTSAAVEAIFKRIHDPIALREFIIMKEILDAPMALRETPMGTE